LLRAAANTAVALPVFLLLDRAKHQEQACGCANSHSLVAP